MSVTFIQARRQHRAVASAAIDDPDRALSLWQAVTGLGDDLAGYPEAVRDTLPEAYAALLASNAVAAAAAFAVHAPHVRAKEAPVVLRDSARRAWKAFEARANQTEEIARGFGWNLFEAWQATEAVQLAAGDMGTVERIAKLAGRMYADLRGANATRVPGIGGEIHSVEQGNNVGRLLPSESVLLTDSDLELPVLERIATRRALQYAVRGTDRAARGPIVMLLDESGSMHEQRREWSKAAAVAMARVAKEERRAFIAVHFSVSVVVRKVDPSSSADVGALISHFLGGGTAVGMAIGAGLDEIEALTSQGQRGADLIVVTDGIDKDILAIERQIARAKAGNVRLWTVAIECDIAETSALRREAAGFTRIGDNNLNGASTGLAGAVR